MPVLTISRWATPCLLSGSRRVLPPSSMTDLWVTLNVPVVRLSAVQWFGPWSVRVLLSTRSVLTMVTMCLIPLLMLSLPMLLLLMVPPSGPVKQQLLKPGAMDSLTLTLILVSVPALCIVS